MKITKTASGKTVVKMSKKDWRNIGKKSGWLKKAFYLENDHWEEVLKQRIANGWKIAVREPDKVCLFKIIDKNIFPPTTKNMEFAEIDKETGNFISTIDGSLKRQVE